MIQQQVFIINIIFMIIDALCVVVSGFGAYYTKQHLSGGYWKLNADIFIATVMCVMFISNYMLGKFRLYSDHIPASYTELLWTIFKVTLTVFMIIASGIFIFNQDKYSRLFLSLFAIYSFLLLSMVRVISKLYMDKVSRNGFNNFKFLIVANKKRGRLITELFKKQLSWGHEIIGRLTLNENEKKDSSILGHIDELPGILKKYEIDEVVFALNGSKNIDLTTHLHTCKEMGVTARILPSLWNPEENLLSVESCQKIPFLTVHTNNLNATGLLYKRILDIAGGVIGFFILVLIYPFIGIAIKLDSPGPILFKQKRVSRHGRVFNLFKFRSMYVDAEERKNDLISRNEMNGAMFKINNDPRITKTGKWLRKTSLDEFPQFINVLRGEMSLVGTRPPTPDEVETYLPQHLKRISSKPGITGLWQISGRNTIKDFEKVVELDCKYLDNWRFSDDLKILFKTIFVVLKRKGAF